jgi:hypothetical protein
VTPAASCPALLQQVIDTGTQTVIGPGGLEPIEGTVELGGPVLLGRGSFDIRDWGRVDFEATREGSTVTGRMAIGRGRGSGWPMNVALECTRTTEDGLIMIGGRITSGPSELATPWAEGSLAAIVLKRGSPVKAAIWVGSIVNWPATQTTDCVAYLDAWLNWSRTSSPSEHWLRDDIKGTVEFGP